MLAKIIVKRAIVEIDANILKTVDEINTSAFKFRL